MLSGIQYFHECESVVQKDTASHLPYHATTDARIIDDKPDIDHSPRCQDFSEEGLKHLKEVNVSLREELHRHMAIELTRHLGIFDNARHDWTIDLHSILLNATQDDLTRISMWYNLLQSAVETRAKASNMATLASANTDTATIVRSTGLPSDPLLDTPTAICQSPYCIFALFALLTSLLVKYLHSHPLYTFATSLSSSA